MNPEERVLLERALKLTEENNQILRKMHRAARWAILWGFIKVLIVVVPLVAGVIYFGPYAEEAYKNFNDVRGLLNGGTSFDSEGIQRLVGQFK